jgi:hypothetical protein
MVIQSIYVFIELLLNRQHIPTVNLIRRKFMNYPQETTLFTIFKVTNYTFVFKFIRQLHQRGAILFIK